MHHHYLNNCHFALNNRSTFSQAALNVHYQNLQKQTFSSVESRLQSENMKRNKKRNGSASHFFLHHKFFCIRSAQINTFLLKTNKNISTADGASFRGCWSKRTEWFETVVNSDMHACRQIKKYKYMHFVRSDVKPIKLWLPCQHGEHGQYGEQHRFHPESKTCHQQRLIKCCFQIDQRGFFPQGGKDRFVTDVTTGAKGKVFFIQRLFRVKLTLLVTLWKIILPELSV